MNTTQIEILKNRFEKNRKRHPEIVWEDVEKHLRSNPTALESIAWMEETGGEPDIIDWNFEKQAYLMVDCSAQSPEGRRSLCYDQKALDSRKENKPKGNAKQMASEHQVYLLDEAMYRKLQTLGEFDTKTSSWIETPESIRNEGGAVFCDRRYNTVFLYHNGADSYYGARGFRVYLWI